MRSDLQPADTKISSALSRDVRIQPTSSVRASAIHDTFYQRNKKLLPHTLLSYISTWNFFQNNREEPL